MKTYKQHVNETIATHGRHSDTSCPPGSRAMCSYAHLQGHELTEEESRKREDKLVKAAGRIWGWVGPGYPDLDDPEEREAFMSDVRDIAAIYFYDYRGQPIE